jgi:hypothetical protein
LDNGRHRGRPIRTFPFALQSAFTNRARSLFFTSVDESWIHFDKSDDGYVRDLIMDEFDMIVEDPTAYGMRNRGDIPAAWVYDDACPGEVAIGCAVPSPERENDDQQTDLGR